MEDKKSHEHFSEYRAMLEEELGSRSEGDGSKQKEPEEKTVEFPEFLIYLESFGIERHADNW